jgi:hypothetical protein
VTVTPDALHVDDVYFCGPGCLKAYQASRPAS